MPIVLGMKEQMVPDALWERLAPLLPRRRRHRKGGRPRADDRAALRGGDESHAATDAFLFSLRPPDRDPPRFGALTPEQVGVVVAFLMALASDADSPHQDGARLALREYWGQGALFP